jgi:hypothetical protein
MNAALERIAQAASNFLLAFDQSILGYKTLDSIEPDLAGLEDAIRSYRQLAYAREKVQP